MTKRNLFLTCRLPLLSKEEILDMSLDELIVEVDDLLEQTKGYSKDVDPDNKSPMDADRPQDD